MLRSFLESAFLIIVIAWVLAEVLSALARWSHKHSNSERSTDSEMDTAKYPDEVDFGSLGLVFAMLLLFLLLMPTAVTSNGQSISLHEISDSMRASKDVGTVAIFVSVWKAEDPWEFWGFFVGLLVTVIWLLRRSPALLGVAVVTSSFILWLKTTGILTLGF